MATQSSTVSTPARLVFRSLPPKVPHEPADPAQNHKIYLLEGMPTGVQTVELSSWTGKGFVIPRNNLTDGMYWQSSSGSRLHIICKTDKIGMSPYSSVL